MSFWRPLPGGVALVVRVTPGARRDAVEGATTDGAALRLRVTALPVEGAANDAVVALLARALGVRANQVALEGGAAARVKRLSVAGDPAALGARLAELARGP